MSVSDPLIKELKGWTRKLTECGTDITDDNPDLPLFCKTLERCFQKGVSVRMNALGFPKLPEAWYWLEEIAIKHRSLFYAFASAAESVRENVKVNTAIGRLRLLIRLCLSRKCLHMPVELLIRSPPLPREFYEPHGLLADEILGEILLSVLLQISKLNFKLNLKNASFLDDTWQLPEYAALELVPCKTLGMSIFFTKGKALIVQLEGNSVAAEDEKIEIGDVLDEINGSVITLNTRGKLRKIMKKAAGQPITVHIMKYRFKQTGDLYGPIVNLIRSCGTENMISLLKSPQTKLDTSKEKQTDSSTRENKSLKMGFPVEYRGCVSTGKEGDVGQIERAIRQLFLSGDMKAVRVRFECLEMGIRVTRECDDVTILSPSYMEISSCGRTTNIPDYFAYIAGETNCNVATSFNAYIFHHQNEEEVQTILQSLGQGFQRTHFVV